MEFSLHKADRTSWREFSKFHYLSHEIAPAAQCYVLRHKEHNVGFIGLLHFPHPSTPKFKRISRVVIKPEWQGAGLGIRFMNQVASIYYKQGYKVAIATGLQTFIKGLHRSSTWKCTRYGRMGLNRGKSVAAMNKTSSANRLTASFLYQPGGAK